MENEICGNSTARFLPILHVSLSYKIRTRCFSILRHFSGAWYYVQIQQTKKFGNSDKRFLPILHLRFYKQKLLLKFGKSFIFILRDLFFHENLARYVYILRYFRESRFFFYYKFGKTEFTEIQTNFSDYFIRLFVYLIKIELVFFKFYGIFRNIIF